MKVKGYRTIIFNGIMTVIAVVALLNPGSELPDAAQVNEIVEGFAVWFALAWGAGNAILRAITNSPIFKKAAPKVAP